MRHITSLLLILLPFTLSGQSKSVTSFRSDFKENTNMFFYSSTLKMLNTDNNPEFAELLDGIEEIRVLNYTKAQQKFNREDVSGLKAALEKESYNNMLMINDKGNNIQVYGREKKGATVGIVALVENTESLIIIDLIGVLDVKKFLELKNKLDARSGG